VDNDRITGSAKIAKGRIKNAVGSAIDDEQLQIEGASEIGAGKIQNSFGKLKDKLKDVYALLVPGGQRN
jgi:uncharacterized protein YjbJ (UPF0337 family)